MGVPEWSNGMDSKSISLVLTQVRVSSFANWERGAGYATNVAYPHAKPGENSEIPATHIFIFIIIKWTL